MKKLFIFVVACVIAGLFAHESLLASSKIWEGEIVKVQGSSITFKPRYTPYASESLYPQFCDTPEKQGKLITINFNQVHVPCIDDVAAHPKEVIAAAKPGMRLLGFMNRKQWHYVSVIHRDADTAVGYVVGVEGKMLKMRRPQANWPNQMSNRVQHSAKTFPDHQFEIEMTGKAVGIQKGKAVSAKSLLRAGQALMVLPARPMRIELMPEDIAKRYDPNIEPLTGNYGEYEHRKNPKFNEQFYRGHVTGWFLEYKLQKRNVKENRPGSADKAMDTWKLYVPYGPKKGEYLLPTRNHKTQPVIAGHFGTFPSFGHTKPNQRVTVWAYRTQKAPNWLLFDALPALVEGTVEEVAKGSIKIKDLGPSGKTITVKIPDNAEAFQLGQKISTAKALKKGAILRIYNERPFTLIAGYK